MKYFKILPLIIFLLITTNQLFAETICMKNSQKARVNPRNKVNIKTPQLLIITDSQCPYKFTELVEVNRYQEPKSFTGVWSLGGSQNESQASDSISFPRALQDAPSQTIFVASPYTDSICKGTLSEPTAPAGVLCIYEKSSFNLKADFSERYIISNPASSELNTVSRFGAELIGNRGDLPSNYFASGTWAVTEP